mmetsp:Transcript_5092/g.10338  ORF Transcript_5092/g.10338 Transcript_5092/m.10338 type:complete len:82 (+) Transcript_5092:226-471(+)
MESERGKVCVSVNLGEIGHGNFELEGDQGRKLRPRQQLWTKVLVYDEYEMFTGVSSDSDYKTNLVSKFAVWISITNPLSMK